VVGFKFVLVSEDAVRARFRGVEIVIGSFEGGEVFNGEVFREPLDRKAGKIVGHSMGLWRLACRVLIRAGGAAD